jgi:hypothetical protein
VRRSEAGSWHHWSKPSACSYLLRLSLMTDAAAAALAVDVRHSEMPLLPDHQQLACLYPVKC